jgi:hypothetical protein
VPVDRKVTGLVTEILHQHTLDPAARNHALLSELVQELAECEHGAYLRSGGSDGQLEVVVVDRATSKLAILELADLAAGLIEALAQYLR